MNRTGIMRRAGLCTALLLASIALANGCATAPLHPVTGYTPAIGEKAAHTAVSMIGRPYKYRGETPSGFDCSGLVRYSYLAAGLNPPHGTMALRNSTRRVYPEELRKGALHFVYERGKPYSHVGIYLEDNVFVHAPSSGKKVRKEKLTDPYWKKSFLEARRFFD